MGVTAELALFVLYGVQLDNKARYFAGGITEFHFYNSVAHDMI